MVNNMKKRSYSAENVMGRVAVTKRKISDILPKYKEYIDYDTWEQMVIVSFSRKSGIKKSLAKAYLTSLKLPGSNDNFLKTSFRNGKNAEAVAKILWCEYHNSGNDTGTC